MWGDTSPLLRKLACILLVAILNVPAMLENELRKTASPEWSVVLVWCLNSFKQLCMMLIFNIKIVAICQQGKWVYLEGCVLRIMSHHHNPHVPHSTSHCSWSKNSSLNLNFSLTVRKKNKTSNVVMRTKHLWNAFNYENCNMMLSKNTVDV